MSIPSVNKVMLVGKVAHTPQLRKIPGNYQLAEFTLSVTRKIRRKNGDTFLESTPVSIVCWGDMAQNVAKYLHEGRLVHVEGRLQFHEWEDKTTGKKRTKHDIIAQNIIYLDKPVAGKRATSPVSPAISGTPTSPAQAPKKTTHATPTPAAKHQHADLPQAPPPEIPPAEEPDPDLDDQWYGDATEEIDDQEDPSPWDQETVSYSRSKIDEEEEWEDELQIPYRNDEPLYRPQINHDEWKDLAEEYDELVRQQERMDLPEEDLEEIGERIAELEEQLESMHDISVVARNLPRQRY